MTGTYPRLCEMALVCLLSKTKLLTTSNDYIPMSILPCISKALKHTIHRELTDYFCTHTLIDKQVSEKDLVCLLHFYM